MPAKTASFIKQTDELKEQEPAVASINDTFGKQKEVKETEEIKESKEIFEEKYEQYLPKKTVSVIMPKQTTPIRKEEPVYMHIPAPVAATNVAKKPVAAITDTALEVETKYSQPLDEIKEMYVKQLRDRKHKTAQKKFIMQSLKKAAIFIAIIGSGVLIGFVIKPKHSAKDNVVNSQPQNTPAAITQTSTKPETIQPENNNNTNSAEIKESRQESLINKNEVATNEQKSQSLTVSENKNSIDEKKKVNEEKDESSVNQQSPSTVINAATGERNKNSRIDNGENESSEKNIALVKDISKLVSVKSNDYKIGAFGGVHNLELTITNDSKFTLDNVMVELEYLKLSEQPVKIEHVRFQSIAPNGSLTIRIPDTNRGAKLSYKIIKIEPKDLNINTAGL